jgi:hypothetical protein
MKKLKLVEGGLADFQGAIDALKDFGRYEDDTLAHVATGETIIPMEVFEKNPQLRDQVFKSMADLGIDPTQYIVGSNFNSINPVTGQPEFFLKKLFKKLKKAAPLILPIAASFIPGVGPLMMGAAGFAGGKIAGQDTKQALMSGIMAGMGGKFAQGSQAAQAGQAAGAGSLGSSIFKGISKEGLGSLLRRAALENAGAVSNVAGSGGGGAVGEAFTSRPFSGDPAFAGYKSGGADAATKKNWLDIFRKKGDPQGDWSPQRIFTAMTIGGMLPSMFEKDEEQEYVDTNVYPGDYGQLLELAKANTYNPGSNIVPFSLAKGGIVNLKEGGFPYASAKRAEGGITGRGTGTSDEIPAYLSNGEFVVTAKAVKNAGGSRPMYDMMNHLEKGGKLSMESRGKNNG